MERDNTPLLIGIMVILTLMVFRLGHIKDLLEDIKSERNKPVNYELQLWNEYRAAKEKN